MTPGARQQQERAAASEAIGGQTGADGAALSYYEHERRQGMARKKVEKAHWMPEAEAGVTLRPLTGYRNDDDKHIRREEVAQVLSDADLRRVQHQVVAVRTTLAEKKAQIDALKNEMRPHLKDEADLMNALVTGTLTAYRDVYEYADDTAGVIHQYDPETKQLLATREMENWERQEEMDLDDDDHDAEDEGHA
jgi:uncharacterized membrane-anchored protein YhcB (DUF1043 family)